MTEPIFDEAEIWANDNGRRAAIPLLIVVVIGLSGFLGWFFGAVAGVW